MPAARLPADEPARLRALAELSVLDSAPEREFDALVHAAALVCGVPISLISLIDANRQWFKANTGLPGVTETPRDLAFCAHAILDDGIFEVSDATGDPRFADNGLVVGEPNIRFYAGAPLRLSDGTCAGTLCVIDRKPRVLDAQQRAVLVHLATAAVHALEGRRALLAERELRETASQAAAVLRNSVDAIITLTLDGKVTHWNAAAQRLFDYSADEMVGQPITRLVPQHRLHEERDLAARLKGRVLGVNYETVRLHRSGEPLAVSVSLAPILSARGELIGAAEIVRDIREQARAAQVLSNSEARFRGLSEQLALSEQRLRHLYQSTPAMLHSIDPQGRMLAVSDHWLATLGYAREEVIGRASSDFLTEASRACSMVNLERFLHEGRCEDLAYQMVCKNGAIIDILLSAVLERDPADRPLRSMAVIQNITERLRVQRALHDERVRLAAIIEGTGAGTWEWHVQTGEVRVNERWAAIIGWSQAELGPINNQFRAEIAHPDELGQTRHLLREHLAGRSEAYVNEVRLRQRDGHWVWVEDRGRLISRTPDGRPEWMFGVHIDISERKRQESALRKSELLLKRTGEVAGVGGWELDLLTSAISWSAQTRRIHGVAPDYVPELTAALNFYPPEARPVIQAAVAHSMATGEGWDLELPFIQADGTRIWVRAAGEAEFEEGRAVRVVGTFQDITAMRSLTLALAEQHELLRVTLQSIGDAVITTEASGLVTWLNPVAERMTGWLNAEAKGHPVTQVFHIVNEETRAPAENPVSLCLKDGEIAGLPHHTVLISRTGAEFGIEDSAAPIRSEAGDLLGVVLVFHDVTEQRRLSGEMSYRATHDALTGLVNRSEFETRLHRVLNKAHEDRSEHALLFIDLDQFKLVNDACGHSVGDQLLQQVAKLLGEAVRTRDTLARLGGDEFAVILEHCSGEQAQRVAQQICERMDDFRFMHDERRFRIGASIGLVPVDKRWSTTAALIQAADTSCYAAKEAGRNRVHAWFDTDQAMRARHGEMQWAARLEQALDENRFVLHAQRIVALDGERHGLHAEVLLRLIDRDGSLIPPGAFLPAAERFHFASRVDRWVLRHAIDALLALADLSALDTLCVNLSGQSIGDRAFHRQAMDLLAEAGTEVCRRLCLEITETAAVTNMADAGVFIEQVRALGVRIALDDFGAGASSFGYLKSLSVDLLKIDGQFIRDLLEDPLDDAAVRCFVDVARVVGVKTVAEFVDRPEVLARLREIGIDFAQGFLLHKPEPLAAVLGSRSLQALRT